ncbi:MAG: exodeoxyribonuclease III [Proteobacteria bacterium]|nr:exodeoxyribonuclease III [Pseudomonadota bacterium]
MRIATWNVNGLRARLDFLLHWLAARQPDVVGLQELKLTDEQFPHDVLASAGYRAATHGQKSWNGVAILTREPITVAVTQRGLPGQDERGARLLTATVGGDLSFTTVYCPNGKHTGHDDFPLKLAWFDALAGHLDEKESADRPTVVCGDFNIVPEAIDSWNEAGLTGAIFHTDEERARLRKLHAWGLRDVFRERHPETAAFSWWDYRGGAFHKNQGLRIDFLLASKSVLGRVREVTIDREYRKKKDGLTTSDHTPVMADLED